MSQNENWIDTDGDNIDDRKQKGPSLPKGENQTQKPKPRPLPQSQSLLSPADSNKTDGHLLSVLKSNAQPVLLGLSYRTTQGQLIQKEYDDQALHEKLKAQEPNS